MKVDVTKPIFLAADNFTPLTRTPWAGKRIAGSLKASLLGEASTMAVGESWEFSCDPDFPSKIADSSCDLPELVRQYPQEVLGSLFKPELAPMCRLLIKLIDAALPLSLQIHPADDDPHLKSNECGKPEAWYILETARPGAGLYLGFAKSLDSNRLSEMLRSGAEAETLLQFVPVSPGDYFEIPPGVPHAIGAGVTLLEPQRIAFGKSGKTFRMWDWGRKYAPDGSLDPVHGTERELHIEQAIAICEPQKQVGLDFVESLRRYPAQSQRSGVLWSSFPANDYCQLSVLYSRDDAYVRLESASYLVLTVLRGKAFFDDKMARQGQTILLPASSLPIDLRLTDGAKLSVIEPR